MRKTTLAIVVVAVLIVGYGASQVLPLQNLAKTMSNAAKSAGQGSSSSSSTPIDIESAEIQNGGVLAVQLANNGQSATTSIEALDACAPDFSGCESLSSSPTTFDLPSGSSFDENLTIPGCGYSPDLAPCWGAPISGQTYYFKIQVTFAGGNTLDVPVTARASGTFALGSVFSSQANPQGLQVLTSNAQVPNVQLFQNLSGRMVVPLRIVGIGSEQGLISCTDVSITADLVNDTFEAGGPTQSPLVSASQPLGSLCNLSGSSSLTLSHGFSTVTTAINRGAYYLIQISVTNLLANYFLWVQAGSTTTSELESLGSQADPIPATTMLQDYTEDAALAIANYTGATLFLTGSVPSVSEIANGGGYTSTAGSIIWNWNQTAVDKVPVNSNFVAQCTVTGLTGDYLVLDNCLLISVPSSQSVVLNPIAYCNLLRGNITITAASYDIRTGNLTMSVRNWNPFVVTWFGVGALPLAQNLTVGAQSSKVITTVSGGLKGSTSTPPGQSTTLLLDFIGTNPPPGLQESVVSLEATTSGTAVAVNSLTLAASYFESTNSGTTFNCSSGGSGAIIGLTNTGSTSVSVTSITITFGGATNNYTPAGACTMGAANTQTAFTTISFPGGVKSAQNAVTGESFTGVIYLSDGSTVAISKAFQ